MQVVNAHETERDLHKLHSFEYRLSRLYTWRQQAKKGKNQKIRRKCATVAPYFSCMISALRKLDRLRLKLYTVKTVNFK